ncbi:MAG: uroporphyrinogen decarboxylase family protein [Spirochaetota bacterium]
MTPFERMQKTVARNNDGTPLFSPAIYDMKPALAGKPAHLFGQNADDVALAMSRELNELGNDVLISAYDIYNVEAEVLGCTVHRSADIPMPKITAPVIDSLADIGALALPRSPQGRMPVFIEAAAAAAKGCPGAVIAGSISGPFSIASHVYPKEKLLIDMMMDPHAVSKLLRMCTDTVLVYARAFAERSIGVFVFDSFIAPPLLSPELYRTLVLPLHKEIMVSAKAYGAPMTALISGGNTPPIFDDMKASGADHFILDYPVPIDEMKRILSSTNAAIRVNIDPQVISEGTPQTIGSHMKDFLSALGHHRNLLVGSGILPMHTPVVNIQAAKRALMECYPK